MLNEAIFDFKTMQRDKAIPRTHKLQNRAPHTPMVIAITKDIDPLIASENPLKRRIQRLDKSQIKQATLHPLTL